MGWRAWFQGAAHSESGSFRPLPRLRLTKVKSSTAIELGSENPGFFTLISLNGTTNPIFWALSHAANANPAPIFLYAFNPEQSGNTTTPIFKAIAGNWPNVGAARTWFLWLVANGKVFVASNKQSRIFGLRNRP